MQIRQMRNAIINQLNMQDSPASFLKKQSHIITKKEEANLYATNTNQEYEPPNRLREKQMHKSYLIHDINAQKYNSFQKMKDEELRNFDRNRKNSEDVISIKKNLFSHELNCTSEQQINSYFKQGESIYHSQELSESEYSLSQSNSNQKFCPSAINYQEKPQRHKTQKIDQPKFLIINPKKQKINNFYLAQFNDIASIQAQIAKYEKSNQKLKNQKELLTKEKEKLLEIQQSQTIMNLKHEIEAVRQNIMQLQKEKERKLSRFSPSKKAKLLKDEYMPFESKKLKIIKPEQEELCNSKRIQIEFNDKRMNPNLKIEFNQILKDDRQSKPIKIDDSTSPKKSHLVALQNKAASIPSNEQAIENSMNYLQKAKSPYFLRKN